MAETQQKRSPHSLEAIAVGTLVSLELKEIKPKDTTKPPFFILRTEIAAAGSKLRTEVWPSKKKPDLPRELKEQLAEGMKVSARGSLEEQVGEDQRLYRSMRAWTIAPADAHEEPKLVYHIAGHLGRLEKTAANELVVPITSVRQYKNAQGVDVDQESTLRVCPPQELTALLYQQAPVGRVIRSRGDIIAKMNVDRFGLPDSEAGFINRLEVALLEVWDDQREIWTPLKAGTQLPPADAPKPTPPRNPAPGTDPDDDVPF